MGSQNGFSKAVSGAQPWSGEKTGRARVGYIVKDTQPKPRRMQRRPKAIPSPGFWPRSLWAWSVDREKWPQRGQFLPDLQPHSTAMGQKDGKKWTAAAALQPTNSKSDRLLAPWPSSISVRCSLQRPCQALWIRPVEIAISVQAEPVEAPPRAHHKQFKLHKVESITRRLACAMAPNVWVTTTVIHSVQ